MAGDLRISEGRFRSLSEASPLGIFATDVAGANTYTNLRWQEIFRMSLEESLGSGWNRYIVAEERERVTAQWLRCAAHNIDYDCTFHLLYADGQRACIRARARATYGEDGQIDGYVGTVSDITEAELEHSALVLSEHLLKRTGELAGVGGWAVDLVAETIHLSELSCRIYGVPDGYRPTYEQALSFYPPQARAQLVETSERANAEGKDFQIELPFIQADGNEIWVRVAGSFEFVDGKAVKLWGALQDITAMRRLSRQLSDQHELLRVTLESIGEAVITTDAQHKITWKNQAAARMTGWTLAEAMGRPFAEVFHAVDEATRAVAANPLTTCMLPQAPTLNGQGKTVLVGRHGREYGIEHSASPIRDDQDEFLGVVLVFYDVTEQRRLVGEMNYRASHDALTGLVNRSEFEMQLKRALLDAPSGAERALLFIDLDQFKLVNDACGHAAGDQLLQQVGKLLAKFVRAGDTLARLGGDEFAVLLNQCSVDQALHVAQQICHRMDDYRFSHKEKRFRIGTSIGLVSVNSDWQNIAALMRAADRSCYAAKESGRNQVHVWRTSDVAQQAQGQHRQWAERIENALDENRFELYAQRIQPMHAGDPLLHAELLLRMIDIDGKLISPTIFLPAAQRFSLGLRVDEWVLRKTVAWLQTSPSQSGVGSLNLNLSVQSATDLSFQCMALELLSLAGTSVNSRLCIELAENAVICNPIESAHFIVELRKLGVKVALDDFGAGAASFGYLKNLTVDQLKIDGQFIHGLIDDALDRAAVRCFADVAGAIAATTVAKSVDSALLLDQVRNFGISYAQGYLLHLPEPLDQLCRSHGLSGVGGVVANIENAL